MTECLEKGNSGWVCHVYTMYKAGLHEGVKEMKPKCVRGPLVAGCGIIPNSAHFSATEWNVSFQRTRIVPVFLNYFFT